LARDQKATELEKRYTTLRESILDTLVKYVCINKLRDLSKIYLKLRVVILPNVSEEKIKELKQCNYHIIQGISGDLF
jgi:hypothetical protein